MEWFIAANANLQVAELQRHIRIETLGAWCAAPPAILGEANQIGNPGMGNPGWSAWCVHREVIRDGVRFTLPGAINALQWTLSAGGQLRAGTVGVHCTLNTVAPEAASVAAVAAFMDAWREGLEAGARRLQDERAAKVAAASAPCAPWFG
jgi:hypothetical protein